MFRPYLYVVILLEIARFQEAGSSILNSVGKILDDDDAGGGGFDGDIIV